MYHSSTSLTGTNTNISGGYYNIAPNEGYLEDGYVLVDDTSTEGYSYTVEASPLATVDGESYNSLSAAIDAAVASGESIILLRNVTLASTLAVANDFTIDYDGNTITYMGSPAVTVASGMTLPTSIDDTQFEATITTSAGVTEYYNTVSKAISAASTSETVVLNTDATMDEQTVSQSLNLDLAGHSITLNDDGTLSFQGGLTSSYATRTLNLTNSSETAGVIYGRVSVFTSGGQYIANIGENVEIRDNSPMAVLGSGAEDSVVVNIYGKLIVEVEGDQSAGATISGNGNGSNDGTTINIYDGAELYGTVTTIYHPQDGKLNIYGGTLTGDTGSAIEVKGGTVNISGGTLISNAEVTHLVNNGGTSTTGYAVALVENASYDQDAELVSITITDGIFDGAVAKVIDSTRTGDEILSIIGGNFANDPSDYVPTSYQVTQADGYYVVGEMSEEEIATEIETTLDNVTDMTVPDTGFDASTDTETITTIITTAENIVSHDSETLLDYVDEVNALDTLFEAAVTADDGIGDLTTDAKEPTTEVSEPTIDTTNGVEVSGLALSVYGGNTADLADGTTTTVYIDVTEKSVADADALVDGYEIDNDTAIVLEIKPMVQVDTAPATEIDNYDLQTPVTFKIYLSDNFEGNRVTVYHITESNAVKTYNCIVYTDENGSYIQLTVTEFSNFILSPWTYTASSGSTNVGTIIYPDETSTTSTDDDDEEEVEEETVATVGGFIDVFEDDYYADAVEWAVENGVTTGTTSTTFSPDELGTRAHVLTFLYRAFGSPETDGENVFDDVVDGSYYSDAVNWGIENDLFGTDNTCTRAQIITFMWRAAGSPEMEGTHDFSDVEEGSYYEMALLWAVENGITNGLGDGTFGSDEPCTRAQIVTFLYRFLA